MGLVYRALVHRTGRRLCAGLFDSMGHEYTIAKISAPESKAPSYSRKETWTSTHGVMADVVVRRTSSREFGRSKLAAHRYPNLLLPK